MGRMTKKMMKKLRVIKVMKMMRRHGIFAMLDANRNRTISPMEMFKPFSGMDKNGDFSVSEAEFTGFMTKAKRPICMHLKKQQAKRNHLSWIQKGTGVGNKG